MTVPLYCQEVTITTSGPGAVAALGHCTKRLANGGLVTVVAYSGHSGGEKEIKLVKAYMAQLDQKEYEAW